MQADPLRLFEPSKGRPWNDAEASRLLRRTGFCPSAGERAAALEQTPGEVVARLIDGPESQRFDELDALGERFARREEIDGLRAWWALRMTHTTRTVRSRMALLWHDHFATSNAKVRSPRLMLQQLRVFERHALGRFGDLLLAVARDPAMIVWLDGNENVNGRPNENFARELFELFALGLGAYTERDIKEAARAFTGWHQRNGRFRFARHLHDEGVKKVFGRTGPLDGDDVVRLTLEQPACARFVARRLIEEFVCPQPPEELVAPLAERLRRTDYDLDDAVRTLLTSEAMFDPRWRSSRIKSPVEFAVGVVRSLEISVGGQQLADTISQMGQRLFEPPSVKGWDGHRAWLNTATMLVRLGAVQRATDAERFDADALLNRYQVDDAEVATFAARLTLDGLIPEPIRRDVESLAGSPADVLRETLRLLMTTPEYQMA